LRSKQTEQQRYLSALGKSLHWRSLFQQLQVARGQQQVLHQLPYQTKTIHLLDILICHLAQLHKDPEVPLRA
jgi:hypothetical protein